MIKIALALGSNAGDRMQALRDAVKALAPYVEVTAVSHVYETAPQYIDNQPPFLNAALIGTTKLTPLALMWNVKKVESEIGRQPTYRFGPRLIDIDIALFGSENIATPELTIPHKHLAEREFVLRPLADIAPDWVDPRSGKTVAELLRLLPDSQFPDLGPLT